LVNIKINILRCTVSKISKLLVTLVNFAKLMWNSNKISEKRGECVELTYTAKGLRSV